MAELTKPNLVKNPDRAELLTAKIMSGETGYPTLPKGAELFTLFVGEAKVKLKFFSIDAKTGGKRL